MAAFAALPGFTHLLLDQIHTVADYATAPGRFVRCQHENTKFFTAWQNLQDGGMSSGHYDLGDYESRDDLRARYLGTTWQKMNQRVKPGATIEITKDGRTIRGSVISAKIPGTGYQDGFFDIEYDILEDRPYSPRKQGRWKQQTDGGTVKIIKDV